MKKDKKKFEFNTPNPTSFQDFFGNIVKKPEVKVTKEEEEVIYSNAKSIAKFKDDEIAIELSHVTKDYKKGRGIFDISFKVPLGKTLGYCGTNGAGKTTTLRTIMGFIKPDKGTVKVMGMDAWKDAEKIKPLIGYLPGEIAFPPLEHGSDFLKVQAEMIDLKDMSKAERIINMMQLDPTANLKRMSKGMKQKTAIVAAFMNSAPIIILDEPTTGLDPLMREAFKELIKEEKARGATIIMSNHMFDELEETCDYVAFIKDGHLVDIVDIEHIHNRGFKEYTIRFQTHKDYEAFNTKGMEILYDVTLKDTYVVRIPVDFTDKLFLELSKHDVRSIKEVQYTLEQYFEQNVIGGMK
ncbi:MAG: ATP-binding cassette domain-containing protein [Bacilli bacterium]|nr:ATP-binding cassette domain-containing protein [Bacilli bacterium]